MPHQFRSPTHRPSLHVTVAVVAVWLLLTSQASAAFLNLDVSAMANLVVIPASEFTGNTDVAITGLRSGQHVKVGGLPTERLHIALDASSAAPISGAAVTIDNNGTDSDCAVTFGPYAQSAQATSHFFNLNITVRNSRFRHLTVNHSGTGDTILVDDLRPHAGRAGSSNQLRSAFVVRLRGDYISPSISIRSVQFSFREYMGTFLDIQPTTALQTRRFEIADNVLGLQSPHQLSENSDGVYRGILIGGNISFAPGNANGVAITGNTVHLDKLGTTAGHDSEAVALHVNASSIVYDTSGPTSSAASINITGGEYFLKNQKRGHAMLVGGTHSFVNVLRIANLRLAFTFTVAFKAGLNGTAIAPSVYIMEVIPTFTSANEVVLDGLTVDAYTVAGAYSGNVTGIHLKPTYFTALKRRALDNCVITMRDASVAYGATVMTDIGVLEESRAVLAASTLSEASGNRITATAGFVMAKTGIGPRAAPFATGDFSLDRNTFLDTCTAVAGAPLTAGTVPYRISNNTIELACSCNMGFDPMGGSRWPFRNAAGGRAIDPAANDAAGYSWLSVINVAHGDIVFPASRPSFLQAVVIAENNITFRSFCAADTVAHRPKALAGITIVPLDGPFYESLTIRDNRVNLTAQTVGGLSAEGSAVGIGIVAPLRADGTPSTSATRKVLVSGNTVRIEAGDAPASMLINHTAAWAGMVVGPFTARLDRLDVDANHVTLHVEETVTRGRLLSGGGGVGRGVYVSASCAGNISLSANTHHVGGLGFANATGVGIAHDNTTCTAADPVATPLTMHVASETISVSSRFVPNGLVVNTSSVPVVSVTDCTVQLKPSDAAMYDTPIDVGNTPIGYGVSLGADKGRCAVVQSIHVTTAAIVCDVGGANSCSLWSRAADASREMRRLDIRGIAAAGTWRQDGPTACRNLSVSNVRSESYGVVDTTAVYIDSADVQSVNVSSITVHGIAGQGRSLTQRRCSAVFIKPANADVDILVQYVTATLANSFSEFGDIEVPEMGFSSSTTVRRCNISTEFENNGISVAAIRVANARSASVLDTISIDENEVSMMGQNPGRPGFASCTGVHISGTAFPNVLNVRRNVVMLTAHRAYGVYVSDNVRPYNSLVQWNQVTIAFDPPQISGSESYQTQTSYGMQLRSILSTSGTVDDNNITCYALAVNQFQPPGFVGITVPSQILSTATLLAMRRNTIDITTSWTFTGLSLTASSLSSIAAQVFAEDNRIVVDRNETSPLLPSACVGLVVGINNQRATVAVARNHVMLVTAGLDIRGISTEDDFGGNTVTVSGLRTFTDNVVKVSRVAPSSSNSGVPTANAKATALFIPYAGILGITIQRGSYAVDDSSDTAVNASVVAIWIGHQPNQQTFSFQLIDDPIQLQGVEASATVQTSAMDPFAVCVGCTVDNAYPVTKIQSTRATSNAPPVTVLLIESSSFNNGHVSVGEWYATSGSTRVTMITKVSDTSLANGTLGLGRVDFAYNATYIVDRVRARYRGYAALSGLDIPALAVFNGDDLHVIVVDSSFVVELLGLNQYGSELPRAANVGLEDSSSGRGLHLAIIRSSFSIVLDLDPPNRRRIGSKTMDATTAAFFAAPATGLGSSPKPGAVMVLNSTFSATEVIASGTGEGHDDARTITVHGLQFRSTATTFTTDVTSPEVVSDIRLHPTGLDQRPVLRNISASTECRFAGSALYVTTVTPRKGTTVPFASDVRAFVDHPGTAPLRSPTRAFRAIEIGASHEAPEMLSMSDLHASTSPATSVGIDVGSSQGPISMSRLTVETTARSTVGLSPGVVSSLSGNIMQLAGAPLTCRTLRVKHNGLSSTNVSAALAGLVLWSHTSQMSSATDIDVDVVVANDLPGAHSVFGLSTRCSDSCSWDLSATTVNVRSLGALSAIGTSFGSTSDGKVSDYALAMESSGGGFGFDALINSPVLMTDATVAVVANVRSPLLTPTNKPAPLVAARVSDRSAMVNSTLSSVAHTHGFLVVGVSLGPYDIQLNKTVITAAGPSSPPSTVPPSFAVFFMSTKSGTTQRVLDFKDLRLLGVTGDGLSFLPTTGITANTTDLSTEMTENALDYGFNARINALTHAELSCVEFRGKLLTNSSLRQQQAFVDGLWETYANIDDEDVLVLRGGDYFVPPCAKCHYPLPPSLDGCDGTGSRSQSRTFSVSVATPSASGSMGTPSISFSDATRSQSGRTVSPSLLTPSSTLAGGTPTRHRTSSGTFSPTRSAATRSVSRQTTTATQTAGTVSPSTSRTRRTVSRSTTTTTTLYRVGTSIVGSSAVQQHRFRIRPVLRGDSVAFAAATSPVSLHLVSRAGSASWRTSATSPANEPSTLSLTEVTLCSAPVTLLQPSPAAAFEFLKWQQAVHARPEVRASLPPPSPDSLQMRLAAWFVLQQTLPVRQLVASPLSVALVLPSPWSLSAANMSADPATESMLLPEPLRFRFQVPASCLNRGAPAPAPVNASDTIVEIFDVKPPPKTVPIGQGAVTVGTSTGAVSGLSGSPSGATVASRSGLVASITTCGSADGDADADEAEVLPIDANPTRTTIGDGPLRYHLGAAIMNTLVVAAVALLQLIAAVVKMTATRNALERGDDRLARLLSIVAGDEEDTAGNDAGVPDESAAGVSATKMKPQKWTEWMVRRQAAAAAAVAREQTTLRGALRWARFPSLTVFPIMFLLQPTVSSAFTLLYTGDEAFAQVVGFVLLLAVAVFHGWLVWQLALAPFPAKFVRPSIEERAGLRREWDDIVASAPGGRFSGQAVVYHIKRMLRSRGDWQDNAPGGTFVRSHFLFLADYTDRCRWNILVEFGFSSALGIVEAMAEAGECRGVDFIIVALFVLYVSLLLYLRGFESRFNYGFAIFLGVVQLAASGIAIAASRGARPEDGSASTLDLVVEVLLLVAVIATAIRAVYDVFRVVFNILRRRGLVLFEYQRRQLERLRRANWKQMYDGGFGDASAPVLDQETLLMMVGEVPEPAEIDEGFVMRDQADDVDEAYIEAVEADEFGGAGGEDAAHPRSAGIGGTADASAVRRRKRNRRRPVRLVAPESSTKAVELAPVAPKNVASAVAGPAVPASTLPKRRALPESYDSSDTLSSSSDISAAGNDGNAHGDGSRAPLTVASPPRRQHTKADREAMALLLLQAEEDHEREVEEELRTKQRKRDPPSGAARSTSSPVSRAVVARMDDDAAAAAERRVRRRGAFLDPSSPEGRRAKSDLQSLMFGEDL